MSQTAVAADVKLSDVGTIRRTDDCDASIAVSRHAADGPESTEAIRSFRVALVTMPYSRFYWYWPSIRLGTMKAIARQIGFPVDDYYLGLDLAAQLGFAVYGALQSIPATSFTGEWLFSIAAFGEQASSADYLAEFPDEVKKINEATDKDAAYLTDLRVRVIPEYIEDCLNKVDWGSYNAVGFDVNFQQQIASLALARRIKEKHPHVKIIFAGSNMDAEMGLEQMRAFPYVDFGIGGEIDEVYPALLTRLAEGQDTLDLLGVVTRTDDGITFPGAAPPVQDLEHLPSPDYDTFYEAAERYKVLQYIDAIGIPYFQLQARSIPFEGSRGCWWGQKAHCTFCGGIRNILDYRSKSPERVLSELRELSSRYDRKDFWAIDDILDVRYIDELFGPLAQSDDEFRFFFYSKANLRRDQVRTLAKGGLRIMWPGIESLNSHVLKLMRKGTSKLQNINLLKWGTYYGVDLPWMMIHGFPGETMEDYADQLEAARLIPHLRPPIECARLRLERFSPYFKDEGLLPAKWRRPEKAYAYIYPDHVNIEEVAWFFDYDAEGYVMPDAALQETKAFVGWWRYHWYRTPQLTMTYRRSESDIVIDDTRSGLNQRRTYTLLGLDADVYEACSDAPRTPAQICAAFSSECPGVQPDEDSIRSACDDFCEAGLMIGEAGRYLSLALPADPEN